MSPVLMRTFEVGMKKQTRVTSKLITHWLEPSNLEELDSANNLDESGRCPQVSKPERIKISIAEDPEKELQQL